MGLNESHNDCHNISQIGEMIFETDSDGGTCFTRAATFLFGEVLSLVRILGLGQ